MRGYGSLSPQSHCQAVCFNKHKAQTQICLTQMFITKRHENHPVIRCSVKSVKSQLCPVYFNKHMTESFSLRLSSEGRIQLTSDQKAESSLVSSVDTAYNSVLELVLWSEHFVPPQIHMLKS